MNILLIHQYFLEKSDGGGSRFNEMSRVWGEQGHHVTVLAGMVHYNRKKKPAKYKNKFVVVDQDDPHETVIRCHVSESYNVNFFGRLWAYFSFVVSSTYAGLFKARRKYDAIVVTSPPLFVGITGYLLSRIKGVPFVFEVRDLWPESAIETGVLTNRLLIRAAYWFESFIYRRSNKINVLTPAFRTTLIEKKRIAAEKIFFVPNAANFALADETSGKFERELFREQHGLNGKTVFVYVGAHGVANHLIQVIDAAEIVRHRQDVLILLIGDGMQKPMLVEQAKKRQLDNVRFVDLVPREMVFQYILASDVGVSVLRRVETFKTIYSNKTFDYMACRKPVLMAIDGISRELIETAKCGKYVEPESPKDFAQALIEWADMEPNQRQRLGQAGYEYAKAEFDRHELALRYLDELQTIAAK